MNSQDLFLLHPVAWSVCQEVLRQESTMIAAGHGVDQRVAYLENERARILDEADIVVTEALDDALSDWDTSSALLTVEEVERRFQKHSSSFTFRQVRSGLRQLGLPDNVFATPLLGFGLLIVSEDQEIAD